ncbi:MAG: hypothetical protein IJU93_06560, partial [Lachnospiraceae bacterium]|nr:hypothetical protein [Lachnospiraceae bacterium]
PETLPDPLFIKPIDGSSSIDAYKVNDASELSAYLKIVQKPMVQEYMEGEDADSGRPPRGSSAMGRASGRNAEDAEHQGAGGPPPGMGGPPPGAGNVWDIDYKEGIETCGDENTYKAVVEAYLEIQDENAGKLESFWRSDDWQNYMILVHALKSSSFTIGAKNFAGFSMNVESMAKDYLAGNNIERNLGYLRGSYNSYAAAYAAVCNALREHMGE